MRRRSFMYVAMLIGVSGCGASPESEPDAGDAAAVEDVAADHAPEASPALDASADVQDASAKPDASLPPGMLDTTVVSQIVEPEGSGLDDASHSYTDQNYWNYCMPGAVTVALYYFLPKDVTGWPAGNFKEPMNAPSTIPSAGTYWQSDEKVNGYHTYGRAYLMYRAEQVKPPSYTTPGIVSFSTYPTTGGTLGDARDALNWEASGHSSTYTSYFYSVVSSSGLTQTKLHGDVKATIDGGHAVVVAADTGYLPNWSRSLSHAITVVGYDDTAVTYKYTDTCGVHCNGSSKSKNGGVWTIAQGSLYSAIVADGAGYIK